MKIPLSELITPSINSETLQPYEFMPDDPRFGSGCDVRVDPFSTPTDTVIFGDSILRSLYIVYDLANERVALAQTKFNATDSNIVAFESLSAAIPSASVVSHEEQITDFPAATQTSVFIVTTITDPVITGTAGQAFDSAWSSFAAVVTATTTSATSSATGGAQTSDKPKGAGNVVRPFASEQLVLMILTTGLFAAGGLFL
jgi:hypothetical protein